MLTVMRIERWDPRRDGPATAAALRSKLEAIGYQVSTCAWPAGAVVPPRSHDHDRIDAVVTGIVKVTLDGEVAILTAGDMVYVPRGAVRKVEVVGGAAAHGLAATLSSARRVFPSLPPRRATAGIRRRLA